MATKVKEKSEIRFKKYDQNFKINIPVLAFELIKENALVRIIDQVVDQVAMEDLEVYYCEAGCPPYHPKMMIKVWVYGYCQGVFTSRRLAKKLREDIGFIWLSGDQQPAFKTLSSFRSGRMKGMVDVVFKTTLCYLVEHGYINLDDLYVDGSKWEANANQYKRVWGKNTKRYKDGVLERISSILEEYEILQREEDNKYGVNDLKEHEEEGKINLILNSTDLQSYVNQMTQEIESEAQNTKQKKLKRLKRALQKEQPKLEKYEEQEQKLGKRNSYSKTDEDATMMRMKDDRLLPGYNVQISTSNQYIVNGTIHQNASDSVTLPPHWEKLEEGVKGLTTPEWTPSVTMDAGYGSEENYELLESKGVKAYVKYPLWYKEIKGELAKRPFYYANWQYNAEQDYYICPNQQKLIFVTEKEKLSVNGYKRILRIYECEGCAGCSFFRKCRGDKAKENTNRTIRFSRKLENHKTKAKELLDTEEGKKKRSQRSTDVETPFGDIKYNLGHRRFILRGKEKVRIEFLFLALAHNMRKIECEETGKWGDYYAQRAAKKKDRQKKRA